MTIHVEDLKFPCIIGVLDFERIKEQLVIINLTLTYDYIDSYIDYAILVDLIQKHMILNKFILLEDAIASLIHIIKKEFNGTNRLYIKIIKPSIMSNCIVGLSHVKTFS